MITEMDVNRFATHSLRDARILRILSAAIEAVDPYVAVQNNLPGLEGMGRLFGLGIGKASIPMMDALAERVSLAGGVAVTKFAPRGITPGYSIIEGGHPVPDARSLYAGEKVLEFVSSLHEEDTLVCLISGGGSALVTSPYVPLEDLQDLTSLLLASGARVDEINTLRRQLDQVKGGGVARATKANIVSLILSDVIRNPLEAIASGPTVRDPTSRQDAFNILKKYHLEKKVPDSVLEVLLNDRKLIAKDDGRGENEVRNIIIGDNELASRAAWKQAEHEGFHAEILINDLQAEAREAGSMFARRLRHEFHKRSRPFCLIAGGETTVTVKGQGKGGRNQELALSAVNELRGLDDVMLVALATDGDDGPTDAAGAVVTGKSAQRAESLGLEAADYLSRNDAYSFFQALDDLIKTGPTGTNVNDLIFLFAI